MLKRHLKIVTLMRYGFIVFTVIHQRLLVRPHFYQKS